MNAEIPPNVETVEMQRQVVAASDSLTQYNQFVDSHFALNYSWLNYVKDWVHDKELDPEFFRFLGFIGIVCSEYGYPSLDGQITRYSYNRWERRSLVDPRHQLALGVDTAKIGIQAIKIKEQLAQEFSDEPEVAMYGVWGLFIRSSSGKVMSIEPNDIPVRRVQAQNRLDNPKIIALSDLKLNEALASLPFNGDDAERMRQSEFETQILPRVVEITQGWMNPVPVFIR